MYCHNAVKMSCDYLDSVAVSLFAFLVWFDNQKEGPKEIWLWDELACLWLLRTAKSSNNAIFRWWHNDKKLQCSVLLCFAMFSCWGNMYPAQVIWYYLRWHFFILSFLPWAPPFQPNGALEPWSRYLQISLTSFLTETISTSSQCVYPEKQCLPERQTQSMSRSKMTKDIPVQRRLVFVS